MPIRNLKSFPLLIPEGVRYLRIRHLESVEGLSRRYERRPLAPGRTVVSLTTIPSRIHQTGCTIMSLLDQKVRPHEIYLNLPKFSRRDGRGYVVPDFLKNCPHVRILECEEDLGPGTKLLPTLKAEPDPDTRIICIDDDSIYPRNQVSTLVHYSEVYPDAALTINGSVVPRSFTNRDRHRVKVRGTRIREPVPVELVTGYSGYLVKPRFFDSSIFDYSGAPGAAFFVDDIWVSGHLARRGVPRYVVPIRAFIVGYRLTALQASSLRDNENLALEGGLSNNEIMMRYFKDAWKLYG